MNILVTGAAGTIGTRLCETLLASGQNVRGMDWRKNIWKPEIDALCTTIDLRDAAALHSLPPSSFDAIVHLAANARVYELVEHPDRACDNFVTTFNVLEFARRRNIPRIIFASSRECYGNIQAEKYDESLARIENCESPYTASKIGGEALVESYTRCYGIDHVTIRFSNVYGMYDDSIRVVPNFIRLARKNEPLTVFGKRKFLDFTYIDDAVSGIMSALQKFDAAKNDTYNIAYGEGTSIVTLAERVKELTGSSSALLLSESRTGEVIQYVADISKAKRTLGYAPATPFATGIEKAVRWYVDHLPS